MSIDETEAISLDNHPKKPIFIGAIHAIIDTLADKRFGKQVNRYDTNRTKAWNDDQIPTPAVEEIVSPENLRIFTTKLQELGVGFENLINQETNKPEMSLVVKKENYRVKESEIDNETGKITYPEFVKEDSFQQSIENLDTNTLEFLSASPLNFVEFKEYVNIWLSDKVKKTGYKSGPSFGITASSTKTSNVNTDREGSIRTTEDKIVVEGAKQVSTAGVNNERIRTTKDKIVVRGATEVSDAKRRENSY